MHKSSITKTINLSLVSYTHNDNGLLSESLKQIANWSVKPKEIILVDDSSTTPFNPPAISGLPALILLRTPQKLGYTGAKALGLNRASCRFILSLDADIRLIPQWLKICLQKINQPKIGMISGPIIPKCGEHLFARYMELTYSLNLGVNGRVKFIPGAAWLMRREVWQNVGGYEGYACAAGEDDFLCKNLIAQGYSLWVENAALAYEVRPMSRLAMVRRAWKWHGIAIKRALLEGRSIVEAVNVLVYSVRLRAEKSSTANPLFLYYDLLYLTYGLADLLLGIPQAASLWASFQTWLAPYPHLNKALVSDILAFGYPEMEKNLLPAFAPGHSPASQTKQFSQTNAKEIQDNGLDIAKALAFAFDETILNTLNSNMDEILVDIS